jgi:Ribonuclease G/E
MTSQGAGRRRSYLDRSPGETRGVITLDERPERLLVARSDDLEVQRLGARVMARVRRIERGVASAFLDLGQGPDAILALTGAAAGLAEGAAVEVEIVAEARRAKGAVARWLAVGEGAPRLSRAAPSIADRLAAFAPDATPVEGAEARAWADEAEAAALEVEHALPGGGSIAIEPTRALTAVDVDLGGRGGDARRAARLVNLAAIEHAARLLRLKALGGLIVIDLIGSGHDGPALAAAAKAAFAPDGPGVSIGPVSRFGLLQILTPRRDQPLAERLCEADGRPSAATTALRLLRALEREGRADGGARLIGRCAPQAAVATEPYMGALIERIGRRFEIQPDPMLARDQFKAHVR